VGLSARACLRTRPSSSTTDVSGAARHHTVVVRDTHRSPPSTSSGGWRRLRRAPPHVRASARSARLDQLRTRSPEPLTARAACRVHDPRASTVPPPHTVEPKAQHRAPVSSSRITSSFRQGHSPILSRMSSTPIHERHPTAFHANRQRAVFRVVSHPLLCCYTWSCDSAGSRFRGTVGTATARTPANRPANVSAETPAPLRLCLRRPRANACGHALRLVQLLAFLSRADRRRSATTPRLDGPDRSRMTPEAARRPTQPRSPTRR
jgi:hypothetical protein